MHDGGVLRFRLVSQGVSSLKASQRSRAGLGRLGKASCTSGWAGQSPCVSGDARQARDRVSRHPPFINKVREVLLGLEGLRQGKIS